MDLLHLMTFFSDLNTAIPLRCPFHALAIVQVGFADAEMFCAPLCFRVLDEVKICCCFCFVLHSTALCEGARFKFDH